MVNVKNPIRLIQTDFRSGEVSPQLAMRVDSKVYASAASSLKNCLLRASGAVTRRPGSTRLAQFAGKRRLISFEFDIDEKYILAFGAAVLDIYDAQGSKLQTFSGGSVPWNTMEKAYEITMSQAGDTMIICHNAFKMQILKRVSLTAFTLGEYAFERSAANDMIHQPYDKHERAEVTLSTSSWDLNASNTITASAAIFSPGWVGDTIRIYKSEIEIISYVSPTQVVGRNKAIIQKKLDPNPFSCASKSGRVTATHAYHGLVTGAQIFIEGSGGELNPGEDLNMTGAAVNGLKTITVIDADHYYFNVAARAKHTEEFGGSSVYVRSKASTRDWQEQAFSIRRGWPGAVCFHEDRLWFGGSTSIPDGVWSSMTGIYFNFSVGEGQDDRSIQLTVGSPRIARIRHMMAGRVLQLFAEGAEFVAKQSDGVALTPSTISIRPQTPYGCDLVRPRPFDGATIFVQGNGKSIREFTYDFNQDGFAATDLTTISPHLINKVIGFDVLYGSDTMTEQYAFFVNTDGTMAVFHSNRSESLAAWTPWEAGNSGFYQSVCTLGSLVFVSIYREGEFWLERIEMDNPEVTLDSSVSASNATASTVWNLGLSYADEVVHITSDNWYLGAFTVNSSGYVTIPVAVNDIRAGFNYDWEVIPLPPDTQLGDGPITGEKRRVSSVTVHVVDSLSLAIDGLEVIDPIIGYDPSTTPVPVTGKLKRYLKGYNRDPVVTMTQNIPLPVTLLGLTMEVSL